MSTHTKKRTDPTRDEIRTSSEMAYLKESLSKWRAVKAEADAAFARYQAASCENHEQWEASRREWERADRRADNRADSIAHLAAHILLGDEQPTTITTDVPTAARTA